MLRICIAALEGQRLGLAVVMHVCWCKCFTCDSVSQGWALARDSVAVTGIDTGMDTGTDTGTGAGIGTGTGTGTGTGMGTGTGTVR